MAQTTVQDFVIAEAAALSGLTVSMLDYLCRQNVLAPSTPGRRGRGRSRRYSFGDVVMLRVIARLLKAGVSVERSKRALRAVRQYHKTITPTSVPTQFLVTDGRVVYFRNKNNLLDLDGSGQMSFLFVLELRHVRNEVLRAATGG